MKHIVLACFLFIAIPSITFTQTAIAQAAPPHVTLATFTAKVNLLDSYIAAGDMTNAQLTWNDVHTMMLNVLAVSKQSIYSATSPADKSTHVTILDNQQNIYFVVWGLKNNLATNRTALHTKLNDFGATIY
jgi:hypothetical protein